jgi:hypothetical protein
MFSDSRLVSTMRWVFVWTYAYVVIVPITSWALQYWSDNTADLPLNLCYLVGAILTVITTGKVGQYFVEKKEVKPDVQP